MFIVKVDRERCKSCGLCIDVCPEKVFRQSRNFNKMGYHYVESEGEGKNSCSGCQRCVIMCPDVAISIYRKKDKSKSPHKQEIQEG